MQVGTGFSKIANRLLLSTGRGEVYKKTRGRKREDGKNGDPATPRMSRADDERGFLKRTIVRALTFLDNGKVLQI